MYLNQGGSVPTGAIPMIDWTQPLDRMDSVFKEATKGFTDFGASFASSVGTMSRSMDNLASKIQSMPHDIKHEFTAPIDVNVNLNGAEVLKGIMPQIQRMIDQAIKHNSPFDNAGNQWA